MVLKLDLNVHFSARTCRMHTSKCCRILILMYKYNVNLIRIQPRCHRAWQRGRTMKLRWLSSEIDQDYARYQRRSPLGHVQWGQHLGAVSCIHLDENNWGYRSYSFTPNALFWSHRSTTSHGMTNLSQLSLFSLLLFPFSRFFPWRTGLLLQAATDTCKQRFSCHHAVRA